MPCLRRSCGILAVGLLWFMTAGCSTYRVTDTLRCAVEQLLLSTATDSAVDRLDLRLLAGRKVFLDTTNLESIDKGYVAGAIRGRIGACGGLLLDNRDDADVIAEIRCGGLGTDRSEGMLGVPSIEFPIPLVGQLKSPELPIVKRTLLEGFGKFVVYVRERQTGRPIFAAGPAAGKAFYSRWWFLVLSFSRTNVPERKGMAEIATPAIALP